MKVILLGNAGAGKSTLSRLMIAKQPAVQLALDDVAFGGGTERRPLQGSIEVMRHWISGRSNWIIEGCYSDIIEPVLFTAMNLSSLTLE